MGLPFENFGESGGFSKGRPNPLRKTRVRQHQIKFREGPPLVWE